MRSLSGIVNFAMNVVSDTPPPSAVPSDRDVVLQFESLGDNCELGLVQRAVGAEPLGLLRFAGVPLKHLLRAMNARFEGLAEPGHIRIQPENGEYMVKLTKYDFIYHAHAKVGEIDPELLHRQQIRTVGFLLGKLVNDLENPEKILVFRQNEPLLAADLVDLRTALAQFGRPKLLWVQAARPGHPPGTVDVIDETLMTGYVKRLALRENAPDFDLPSWLTVLRRAWSLSRAMIAPSAAAAVPAPRPPVRTEVTFGVAGNGAKHCGVGWSGLEDGFTWSVDDVSVVTLDASPDAQDYWLEMDVIPYVFGTSLPAQSLAVTVNGTHVHTFDPLTRGLVGCSVPGLLVRNRDKVEILLEHPRAARPHDLAGENDTRRLAVAFRSLSLVGIPES
jgi:hypothetical protein